MVLTMTTNNCWRTFYNGYANYLCDQKNGHEGCHISDKDKVREDNLPYETNKVKEGIKVKEELTEEQKKAEHDRRLKEARDKYNNSHKVDNKKQAILGE